MDNFLLNESLDSTFLQINDLDTKNEHYISSHKFNLFQQFFIIGLDPKIIYNINDIELLNYPSQYLEPKIISKYPSTSLPYLCIPDKILASHCFPNGLKNKLIKTDKREILKEEYFVFSIDNQGFEDKESSLRTKRVYYTCYLFYESIEDYRKCINLRNIKKNKNFELNQNLYIPKVICFSSFIPFYKKTTLILKYLKQYVDKYSYNNYCLSNENNKNNNNNEKNLVPIEKIIEGIIFNIPSLPRSKFTLKIPNDTFGIQNNEEKNASNKNIKEDTNNYKEVIFRVSPPNKMPLPLIDFSKLMYYFNIDDIFEIIKWIILEVPILFFCENIKDLTYTIEGIASLLYPFEYSYPIISILPEINYPFISIMKHFIFGINYKYSKEIFSQKGINIQNQNIIIVVKIEKRFNEINNFKEREKDKSNTSPIIVFKSDKNRPVLKLDQLNSYYSEIHQQEKKKIEQGNAKKQKITLPTNHKEKLKKKFIDNIELKVKEICYKQKKKKLSKDEYSKIINEELCQTIFNFFVTLLLHYQQYCFKLIKKKTKGDKMQDKNSFYKMYEKDDIIEQKYNENKIEINDIFNVNDFLNTIPQIDKLFYTYFLSTKLFFNFMMKKIFPVSIQDKLDILFFDEKINEKVARDSGNKKFVSLFLKYDFNNMKENIVLSSFRKPITQDYTEFLLSKQNQFRALNYFQYINKIENKNIIKDEDNMDDDVNDVSFSYFVFPKLLNDDIFYKEEFTIEKFWAPDRNIFTATNSNCIFKQFDKQGQLIISNPDYVQKYNEFNYSLELVSTFDVKMKDFIHLLWLQYFAKTFHYTPLSERKIQFEQMMTVLKTVQIVDQNTYNCLFWVINKYGDRNMNQDLFMNLKNKTYITFLALREKIKQQNNFIRYSDNIEISEEEKNEKLKNKSMILFEENSNCENHNCNEQYNIQMKFLVNESISPQDNFVKFKCEKCKTEQHIWVLCVYDNGLGKGININFRLISPLALLKRKWFQDQIDLDLYYLSKEHLEPYMSALYYFYLQGIFCEFMIPPKKKNIEYKIEQNSSCTLDKDTENKNKIVNTTKIHEKKIIKSIMKKKDLGKIKKVDNLNKVKNDNKKEELKKTYTLNKSVSQNYLETMNKKKLKKSTNFNTLNRSKVIGRNIRPRLLKVDSDKLLNSVDMASNEVDLDISGDSKGLFEYRGDSKNTKKNPFKKKAQIISIKKKMLTKNDSGLNNSRNSQGGFQLSGQNSYEYFKTKKKKK